MYRLYLECSFMYSRGRRQWKYIKVQQIRTPMVPLVTIHTAWEDQRRQVCQCMLYGTGYPLGFPVPYENSGTLTPLIYHAPSGTGKPCSLLVASGSLFKFLEKKKIQNKKTQNGVLTKNKYMQQDFPRICFTKSTVWAQITTNYSIHLVQDFSSFLAWQQIHFGDNHAS